MHICDISYNLVYNNTLLHRKLQGRLIVVGLLYASSGPTYTTEAFLVLKGWIPLSK